jgi:hypothetical protein
MLHKRLGSFTALVVQSVSSKVSIAAVSVLVGFPYTIKDQGVIVNQITDCAV